MQAKKKILQVIDILLEQIELSASPSFINIYTSEFDNQDISLPAVEKILVKLKHESCIDSLNLEDLRSPMPSNVHMGRQIFLRPNLPNLLAYRERFFADGEKITMKPQLPQYWAFEDEEKPAYIKFKDRTLFIFKRVDTIKFKLFKHLWNNYKIKRTYEDLYNACEFSEPYPGKYKKAHQTNTNIRRQLYSLVKDFNDSNMKKVQLIIDQGCTLEILP
jgi:hypothetical protein